MAGERAPLVGGTRTKGLSWIFATFCIVDLFGVFPVVALPRPIIDCGWLGIPLSVFVIGLQMYTAYLLSKCWLIAEAVDSTILNKTRYPYAAIAELCFGVNAARFVTVVLQLTIFGGGIPNLLVASQMLQMVGQKTTNFEFDLSFCYWMIILGVCLCPVMWLGSPRDMKFLAVTSVLTVLTVAALTWTSIIQDDNDLSALQQPEPSWEAAAIAYGILAFQFDVHPLILTIQVDMDKKQKMGHAILGGFAVSGGLYIVTTALARYKYGAAVSRNLLQVMPGSPLLYTNVVLVTLQICLSMVVGGSALFQDVEDKLNIPRDFNWKRCVVRSAILMSSVLIGEFVPRFDLIMGLIGGALTSPLMFMFPSLFYLKLNAMRQQRQQQQQRYYEKQPYGEQTYYHRNCVHDAERDSEAAELCFEPVLPSAGGDRTVDCDCGGYYGDDFMLRSRRSSVGVAATPPPLGLGWTEKIACVVIIVMGVLATVAATYVSLRDTLRVAQITSPCFL